MVEELFGTGDLMLNGEVLRPVRYRITRFQAVVEGSGLPIPGLHRLEGSIDFDSTKDPSDWIGAAFHLKLDDGRVLAVTLADRNGRILNEGHGPSKCGCC